MCSLVVVVKDLLAFTRETLILNFIINPGNGSSIFFLLQSCLSSDIGKALAKRGRLFCEPASPSLEPRAARLFLQATKNSRQKIQKWA